MAFDNPEVSRSETIEGEKDLRAVGTWLELYNSSLKGAIGMQKNYLEDMKTYSLQATRNMQDATRATCEILALSPIPEVAHFAKVTESYVFNTHKREFTIPHAKSVERVNIHELADLIHVTPEVINTKIRPKLVIPAASSHDEMLAQDTSAAMTRYETDHYVLARKSGEELSSEIDSTMDAEIGMMIETLRIMHEKHPDGFDVIAICEANQIALIAIMVCLQEYGFAPKNIAALAPAMFPDADQSKVSQAARDVSNQEIDALAVSLPSGVRIIPAETNILSFLGQSFNANWWRAMELYLVGVYNEDKTRKGIHQNKLMMNGRSFTADNFLGKDGELGKKDRYFTYPEIQTGCVVYKGKKYYLKDLNIEGKYIPVGGMNDQIAPIKQGTAILEFLPESIRGKPIKVNGGHYAVFTGGEWRIIGCTGIVEQMDSVILDPEIFKNDVLYAA